MVCRTICGEFSLLVINQTVHIFYWSLSFLKYIFQETSIKFYKSLKRFQKSLRKFLERNSKIFCVVGCHNWAQHSELNSKNLLLQSVMPINRNSVTHQTQLKNVLIKVFTSPSLVVSLFLLLWCFPSVTLPSRRSRRRRSPPTSRSLSLRVRSGPASRCRYTRSLFLPAVQSCKLTEETAVLQ